MEKGTIIYVGAFEMPDRNAAAHRVSTIAKIFESLGFRTVFLGRAPENERFDGVRKSSFSDNVYEISAPASTKEWVKYMFDTSAIKCVCEKHSDVRMIILYDMPYFSFIAAESAFSKKGIRVVYDCAEWADATEGSFLKRTYKKFDDMLIRRCLGRRADGVICISNMMKSAYKGNRHLIKLPPMVDINDPIWHQEKISHGDKLEFCFAGTIGSGKECLDRIISSFSSVDSEKAALRIIGVTKDEFSGFYPELSERAEDNRITFMGRLSHTETIRYVLSCDCYIFIREPTRKNNAGFPTKFVEAFTCCVPIITTDTSDIKQYAEENSRITIIPSITDEAISFAMKSETAKKRDERINAPDDMFHFERYGELTEKWLKGF